MEVHKKRKLVEPETAVDEYFLDDKSIDSEKRQARKRLAMPPAEEHKTPMSFYDMLRIRLYKAGLEAEPQNFIKTILHVTWIIIGVGTLLIGLIAVWEHFPYLYIGLYILIWWVLGFVFTYSLAVVIGRSYLNFRIFKRKLDVEHVLPEFLRLVATNYRSGLPLDEALNKSNRPRFGVLSKEIDIVSKTARIKGDLAKALEIFGKKYDSKILERAMNSVAMSIRTGSNISDLLEEIANNITKMRNMRASMAANVKNYLIFIIVAGIVIAPLMFSMSYHMNITISSIKTGVTQQQAYSQPTILSGISSEGGMSPANFNVFAILMLLTNSIISGLVISLIKYGNYQQGVKRIPVFLGISVVLYFIGKLFLGFLVVLV